MIPKRIKAEKGFLVIKWDNEEENSVKLANLRYNCPCALCMEEKNKNSKEYIPLYNENELAISNIRAIGNYAVAISWKDGHDTEFIILNICIN